ncbi:MAG TPA: glycosyltransferase family 39 protein [Pyrinomonadaceae bacterium]|jgi:4-amino-4-deoxy-L-arabinose transferase-like glycosyltransferase|nr:glycosyltransferase family 39 protein [Pyrinomonadaceae bacterium]
MGTRIKTQVLPVLLLLVTLLSVRVLTLMFMRAHLNDPAWFQTGSYSKFDRQARDILDGRQRVFLIDDPTRTDLAQYPPAFPASVAAVYGITGERSAYVVQLVQWAIDLVLSLVLIVGITVTAFGWRAGFAAGFLAALLPLFAMYAAYPSADIPGMWFVLAGNWLLLLAAKRNNVRLALAAGALLGVACWFRVNPLYLAVGWGVALLLVAQAPWRQRLAMSGAAVFATVLVISPIVIRNYLTFPDFTPTGGTIGVNLWEGLGETEFGRQHGFLFGDDKLIEYERVKLGWPADTHFDSQWPDGIRRDKERTRESMAFIKQHPVWYAGVMAGRMWGMLKVAGDPVPYCGISGINVTSQKCLSPAWQGGVVAFGVNVLGMIQSVARYLFLPLAAFGIYVAARKDRIATVIFLVTILYYLVPGTAAHTEIRYVLPMHGLLTVFAAAAVDRILQTFRK